MTIKALPVVKRNKNKNLPLAQPPKEIDISKSEAESISEKPISWSGRGPAKAVRVSRTPLPFPQKEIAPPATPPPPAPTPIHILADFVIRPRDNVEYHRYLRDFKAREESLKKSLTDVQNEVKKYEEMIRSSKELDKPKQTLSDFLAKQAFFKDFIIDPLDSTKMWCRTEDVICEGINFGQFGIGFGFSDDFNGIQISPFCRNKQLARSGIHPFIDNYCTPCFGNVASNIRSAYLSNDIAMFMVLLQAWFHTDAQRSTGGYFLINRDTPSSLRDYVNENRLESYNVHPAVRNLYGKVPTEEKESESEEEDYDYFEEKSDEW